MSRANRNKRHGWRRSTARKSSGARAPLFSEPSGWYRQNHRRNIIDKLRRRLWKEEEVQ